MKSGLDLALLPLTHLAHSASLFKTLICLSLIQLLTSWITTGTKTGSSDSQSPNLPSPQLLTCGPPEGYEVSNGNLYLMSGTTLAQVELYRLQSEPECS